MEKQPITALLDANVLYPAPVRDLLLHLADAGLYYPKWSGLIHDEWIKNLLINRPDLKPSSLKAAKRVMNVAFPDADIKGFFHLMEKLQLPVYYFIKNKKKAKLGRLAQGQRLKKAKRLRHKRKAATQSLPLFRFLLVFCIAAL